MPSKTVLASLLLVVFQGFILKAQSHWDKVSKKPIRLYSLQVDWFKINHGSSEFPVGTNPIRIGLSRNQDPDVRKIRNLHVRLFRGSIQELSDVDQNLRYDGTDCYKYLYCDVEAQINGNLTIPVKIDVKWLYRGERNRLDQPWVLVPIDADLTPNHSTSEHGVMLIQKDAVPSFFRSGVQITATAPSSLGKSVPISLVSFFREPELYKYQPALSNDRPTDNICYEITKQQQQRTTALIAQVGPCSLPPVQVN